MVHSYGQNLAGVVALGPLERRGVHSQVPLATMELVGFLCLFASQVTNFPLFKAKLESTVIPFSFLTDSFLGCLILI